MGLWAGAVSAEFARVADRDSFVAAVRGKTLARPLVELRVSPDGGIRGTGAKRPVTGRWQWQGGYFCRDLYWGNRDLGYNCQEVRANGDRIRFTSDKGRGQSAEFRLR